MSQSAKVAAAAIYLDVDRKTVLKYIHLGILPAVKYGKRNSPWRIKVSDLQKLKEGGKHEVREPELTSSPEPLPDLDEGSHRL